MVLGIWFKIYDEGDLGGTQGQGRDSGDDRNEGDCLPSW